MKRRQRNQAERQRQEYRRLIALGVIAEVPAEARTRPRRTVMSEAMDQIAKMLDDVDDLHEVADGEGLGPPDSATLARRIRAAVAKLDDEAERLRAEVARLEADARKSEAYAKSKAEECAAMRTERDKAQRQAEEARAENWRIERGVQRNAVETVVLARLADHATAFDLGTDEGRRAMQAMAAEELRRVGAIFDLCMPND